MKRIEAVEKTAASSLLFKKILKNTIFYKKLSLLFKRLILD